MQSHHGVRTLLLAAAVVLATTAVSHAVPITTLFNTGVDTAGISRGNNATELHYVLTSVPSGTTGVRVGTSANGFPIGPWVGDNARSAWIGPSGAADLTGPVGNYTYETTFDLTGFQASTASIAGLWSADNAGLDILINGISTNSTATDFRSFYGFVVTRGFVSGVNTLDFVIRNDGGPTGLRVEMTGTASPAAVPEPISLAILGSGLFALGMLRRKRA